MKVLIAVASSSMQHVGGIASCYALRRGHGDDLAIQHKTRGDAARDALVAHFLESPAFDALLMLDGDQRHPPDLLEKLRESAEAGDLDAVCAHYYRRETRVVQSLCYEVGDGTYPFLPLLDVPRDGLHEIAWTGFGCVLIRRRVLEAVAASLPKGASPVGIGPLPEVAGDHDNFGPDCRFWLRARALGFRLWLRADVESLHATTLWLGHKSADRLADPTRWADGMYPLLEERLRIHGMTPEAFRQRLRLLEARKRGLLEKLEAAKARAEAAQLDELSVALYTLDGKMAECRAWLEWSAKYPRVERAEDLPTTENTPAQPTFAGEDRAERENGYKERAADLMAAMPQKARLGAGSSE